MNHIKSARQTLTSDQVDFCREVATSAISDMEGMRTSTESAALKIGEHLSKIVEIATASNSEIANSLKRFVVSETNEDSPEENSQTIKETINRQSELITGLIATINDCFSRQLELSKSGTIASRSIYATAKKTEYLMARSRMLALNMRIEAQRLGTQGKSFAVLANEMKEFSDDVAKANVVIAETIEEFANDMPIFEKEATELGEKLSQFSQNFEREMADVQSETESLSSVLEDVLEKAESRNEQILENSYATLSNLQFQDPVSQGLQRAEHNLGKIVKLVQGEVVDDMSLPEISDEVGNDGTDETDSGDVLLF